MNEQEKINEGLLNALNEVCTAAQRIATSHRALMGEMVDPGSEAHGAQREMDRLLRQATYAEPNDWTYVSRFSATPHEIHRILANGLCEDVHLNYQQSIGNKAAHEAAEDIRQQGENSFTLGQRLLSPEHAAMYETLRRCADLIDPEIHGGPYPSSLVRP